ncbi:hypothetical protein GCM10020255_031100 [Rhodococcus baikonurensis]
MSQASTVICCVSYVGDDEQQCVHVNEHGIRNAASIATAVGVERLLYVSTAAVYGPGPFRDLPVNGAPLKPSHLPVAHALSPRSSCATPAASSSGPISCTDPATDGFCRH